MEASNMKPLEFDVSLKTRKIVLRGDGGTTATYILKELDGRLRDQYMQRMGQNVKMDGTGKVIGFTNFDGSQSGLLALCLYKETGELVPEKEIQLLPSRVVNGLYEAASELSELNVNKDVKAKSKNE